MVLTSSNSTPHFYWFRFRRPQEILKILNGINEELTKNRKKLECRVGNELPANSGKKRCPVRWGATPPTTSLGSPIFQNNRDPPTWGCNFVNVKQTPKASDGISSDVEVHFSDDTQLDDDMEPFESAVDFEQFIDEFKKGVLQGPPQIKPQRVVAQPKADQPQNLLGDEMDAWEESEAPLEEEFDETTVDRIKDIDDDSHLINYIKKQLDQSANQRKINRCITEVRTTSPALVGIPMTTPRPSPSPRRPRKLEKPREEPSAERTSSQDAVEEESDNELEDDDDEDKYEKWVQRLKRLQWECERQITELDSQKK